MSTNNFVGKVQKPSNAIQVHTLPEKISCRTPDLAEETRKKLLELIPECAGEGGSVDFDKLRQALSSEPIEGNVERYEFTWPGKRKARAGANAPIAATLRPCRDESVDFDTTGNLYIEGNNLEVLKLLQSAYAGKVKMIYIDPPYNKGEDRIYRDHFTLTQKEIEDAGDAADSEGNLYEVNDSSEARFHSNWCSMMWPRLKLARNLLRDDGVIFISIDDDEVANLRKLCDEIFGEANYIAQFVWEKKKKPSFLHRNVGTLSEYVLCYAKQAEMTSAFSIEKTTEGKKYPINNAGNPRAILSFPAGSVRFGIPDGEVPAQDMSEGNIVTILKNNLKIVNGRNAAPFQLEGEWRYSQDRLDEIIANGEEIVISKIPFRPNHIKSGGEIKKMGNMLSPTHYAMETNEDATEQFRQVMGGDYFDNPKPIKLISSLCACCTYDVQEPLILDFFSGSATTAHAIMQLNAEDGGNRKFIMVQLPEICDPDGEAAAAGYETICEIGKERIRRAGEKVKDENALTAPNLDVGFRVLKLDSSSLNDTSTTPGEATQESLGLQFSRIRDDRSPEDLLFQLLLETRIPLSDTIATAKVGGNDVFFVGLPSGSALPAEGAPLVACLDPKAKMDTQFFLDIAKLKPGLAFFRDDAFADDSARTNLQQAFDQFSPSTSIKVI